MNSELDKMFERGLADVSRASQSPLSDEQIAAAAKESSRTGVVLWMRMHANEILLCVILLSVGIVGTLLVTHFTGNQRIAPEPVETMAAVACDTAMGADDTDVLSDGPLTKTNTEPTASTVETLRATSLQTDQSITTSAKTNAKPVVTSVETRHAASPQTGRPANVSAKHDTEPAAPHVIVKKTIVQRDTVVINETVIIKDTTYVP